MTFSDFFLKKCSGFLASFLTKTSKSFETFFRDQAIFLVSSNLKNTNSYGRVPSRWITMALKFLTTGERNEIVCGSLISDWFEKWWRLCGWVAGVRPQDYGCHDVCFLFAAAVMSIILLVEFLGAQETNLYIRVSCKQNFIRVMIQNWWACWEKLKIAKLKKIRPMEVARINISISYRKFYTIFVCAGRSGFCCSLFGGFL